MLRYRRLGPFPAATDGGWWGDPWPVVHFTLMAIMATVFMLLVRSWPQWLEMPWPTALGYGLITYVAMNLIVVPLRFGVPLPPKPISIATQLFAHIVLVGLVMTWVARRYLRPRLA